MENPLKNIIAFPTAQVRRKREKTKRLLKRCSRIKVSIDVPYKYCPLVGTIQEYPNIMLDNQSIVYMIRS